MPTMSLSAVQAASLCPFRVAPLGQGFGAPGAVDAAWGFVLFITQPAKFSLHPEE
jgi:hypothetical protein